MCNLKRMSMRNFYQKIATPLFIVAVMSLIGVNALQAQENIKWSGGSSTNALLEDNWFPAMGIEGNHLIIPHIGEYADPENPKHPVIESDSEITIESISIDVPYYFEEPLLDENNAPVLDEEGNAMVQVIEYPAGQLTIKMADEVILKTVSNSNGAYMRGTLIVESGIFQANRPLFFDADGAQFIARGTSKVYGHKDRFFMIGDRDGKVGATVLVEDEAYLEVNHSGGIDRWWPGLPHSTVTVKDNAKIAVAGDKTGNYVQRVADNQLLGGENHYPHFWYDVPTNKTIVVAIPNNKPQIYFADRQTARTERLLAEDAGSELAIETSALKQNGTSFVWKYGETTGGPYDKVLETKTTGENIIPLFTEAGNFFLVCEITDENGTYVSNEISYQIAPNYLNTVFAGKQYLRGDQKGGKIVFTVKGELEEGSAEWKWSTTSGSGYQSFETPVKGLEYTPDFNAIGVYYIVLEATVNGEATRSFEIEIEKQAYNAGALPIKWTAAVDEDFGNMFNWSPHAYPNQNAIEIPVTAPMWPIFTTGTDTIMAGSLIAQQDAVMDGETVVTPEIKAELIIRGSETDTLQWRGDTYGLRGLMKIESGVFTKQGPGLLRFEYMSSEIQISGNGVALFGKWNDDNSSLCFGNSNAPNRGGQIYMRDNAKMIFDPVATIFRFPTNADATFAKIHIQDNAQIEFIGDFVTGAASYDKLQRFVLPENHVLKNIYNPETNFTYVTARDLTDFAIANDETQYVSVEQSIEKLTLTNVGSLENFTWKYSTSAFGPWLDFAEPVVGDVATASFETPGTYYIIAQASDETLSSNVVKIVALDFKVLVDEVEGIFTLSVELPEGAKAEGGTWVVKAEGETEYENSDMAGGDLEYELESWHFGADGVYIVSYKAIYVDENAQDVDLFATPVAVTIVDGEIASVETAVGIKNAKAVVAGVYPNPNNGTFTLTVNADSYTVEVIDLAGNIVSKAKLSGNDNTITINNRGVYILKVTSKEGVTTQRVLVK